MVGNLMELKSIDIHFLPYVYAESDDGDEMPNRETLTRSLRYLRHDVAICSSTEDYDAGGEEIRGFARAIHGHPMISEFHSDMDSTFENLGPWCSALATLPSLKDVSLDLREPETEDQRVLVDPEPLTELLRAPALRYVTFDGFSFSYALCHAVANALEEGSPVTSINFGSDCSFPDGGAAIIVNALKTNT
jgi:hypothetical protein